jgi:Tol biopolymer transport system component
VTQSRRQDWNATWSPNGAKILFDGTRNGRDFGSPGDDVETFVMNPDGSGATNLSQAAGRDCCGVGAPDSKTIVFQHSDAKGNTDLYSVETDGHRIHLLWRKAGKAIVPGTVGVAWRPQR